MLLRLAEYAFIVSTTLTYSEKDLGQLDTKIVLLLSSMKKALHVRTEDMMWTFVKFHLTTHVTWWIKRFGHCGQIDAATWERLHKIVITTPSQCCHNPFTTFAVTPSQCCDNPLTMFLYCRLNLHIIEQASILHRTMLWPQWRVWTRVFTRPVLPDLQ